MKFLITKSNSDSNVIGYSGYDVLKLTCSLLADQILQPQQQIIETFINFGICRIIFSRVEMLFVTASAQHDGRRGEGRGGGGPRLPENARRLDFDMRLCDQEWLPDCECE